MTIFWTVMYGISTRVIQRFRITCTQLFRCKDNFGRFMLNVGTYLPDPTASHRENCHFSIYHIEKSQNPKFYPKTCNEGTECE